jgi:hypothetical protein
MIVTLNTTNIQANAILYLYESGGNCYVVLEYLTGLPVNEAPLQVSQSYDALQDALGSTFFEAGHASFGNILINASRLKSISAEGVLTFDNNRAVTTTSSVSAVKSAAEQASPASVQYVDENAGGGGGVSDGNKGDITVSGSGSVWKLNASAMRKIMAINAS